MADSSFSLRPALPADIDDIVTFLLGDFLKRESLTIALGIDRAEAEPFFRFLTARSVRSGTSLVMHNESNVMVGVRLSELARRPESGGEGEGERKEADEDAAFEMNPKVEKIEKLHEVLDKDMWSRIPAEVHTLLFIVIVSVSSDYGRRGLGARLLHEQLGEGVQGILAESTAISSQNLFHRLGYTLLHELAHADFLDERGERVFNCSDGTDKAQLVMKLV